MQLFSITDEQQRKLSYEMKFKRASILMRLVEKIERGNINTKLEEKLSDFVEAKMTFRDLSYYTLESLELLAKYEFITYNQIQEYYPCQQYEPDENDAYQEIKDREATDREE